MRIALVHEYLNQFGGAERVLQVLCAMFPDAPIYTLFYDKDATGGVFEGKEIRTSFLQKIPFINQYHYFFPLLMSLAVEQFDFSEFDIVISISTSFAKGIITKPQTRHICYCLTPPRFLWDDSQKFMEEFRYPIFIKKILPPLISYLRLWDREASYRVDEFWSISNFVSDRIKKYYLRDSKLIYPPVNLDKFYTSKNIGDYFFIAGRLVSYKRFDIVIEAFNQLGWLLKIAGIGPEMKRLQNIAKSNIEFLGLVSDNELSELYSHSKALIFPQEEDFGITPLEAMASGRPVIAYRGGGAMETVIEGESGTFFNEQTKESLIECLNNFDDSRFKPEVCLSQATKFNIDVFKNGVLKSLY
ncbi:MAG: glycosyltransferase [bacterium]|nr:glycosyltransferase [bacterium]